VSADLKHIYSAHYDAFNSGDVKGATASIITQLCEESAAPRSAA